MDSDDYDLIYCCEDDENRVFCNFCDKLYIERFFKNHLKSQTHANNTRKRQQIIIQFRCDYFDIDMHNVSRNIQIDSHQYKQCLRERCIIYNPNFLEKDKILSDYVERNSEKFDFYLVNYEFKIELKNFFKPHIKKEYF